MILTIFILSGCGYNAMNNTSNIIITDIEQDYPGGSKEIGCYYYVIGATHWGGTANHSYFFDKCGLYTVGDTIKISKK